MKRAKYICVEGIDGAGKTTHTRLLAEWLEKQGYTVHNVSEPSKSEVGFFLRSLLKGDNHYDQRVLALMFAADSLHQQVSINLASSDLLVLSDRSFLSTYAYQLPECEINWLDEIHRHCTPPDLTLFIDVAVDLAMTRLSERKERERVENPEALARAQANYHKAISHLTHRGHQIAVVQVDSTDSVERVELRLEAIIAKSILGVP